MRELVIHLDGETARVCGRRVVTQLYNSLSLLPPNVQSSPSAFGSCKERSEPSSVSLAQSSESLQLLSALCLGNPPHSQTEPGLPLAVLLCGHLSLGPPWK